MQRSISRLMGCSVKARDGEIGVVNDFYFDDHAWTIRYMVVNTGGWLSGRDVLISTAALRSPVWKARTFPVDLTRRQVRHSPGLDTHRPVSREHEVELHQYYGWPVYWGATPMVGFGYPMPMVVPPIPAGKPAKKGKASKEDTHLRSASQVTGYYIHARDGEIGHVQDFIVDDKTWAIRYIVVNTRNWLPGKQVLIAPHWIGSVDWRSARVTLHLSRRQIQESPEYDPSRPVTEDYRARLDRHYERSGGVRSIRERPGGARSLGTRPGGRPRKARAAREPAAMS